MRKDTRWWEWLVFGSLVVLFLVLIVSDAFGHMRAGLTDRLYGGKQPVQDIVIIAIDDASIQEIGRWPWDRSVMAALLERVNDARVVGVDVSFFEQSASDPVLAGVLARMQNVVLAAEVNEGVLYAPIFPVDFGYVNVRTDGDGVTRSVDTGLYDHVLPLAFRMYEKSFGGEQSWGKRSYLVNFPSGPGSFPALSVKDVLAGNQSMQGKVVFIGATAPNLHDNYFVPTSAGVAMPGVEIHATIFQNVVLDNFLARQDVWSTALVVLVVGFFGMFVLARWKIYYTLLVIVGALLGYSVLAVVLFENRHYILDLFFLPIALFVCTAVGVGVHYLKEKQHSAYLTDAFGKYVSKELLHEIMGHRHQLKLGGAKREITIFFSDLRNFTTMSERLKPEELVALLNEYFTEMTRIILQHQGTVDKFIGDAIMAFWNAPLAQKEHARLACAAALEQVQKLKALREEWKARGLPQLAMGIGVHTGEAIIGNMGSEDRFDYTAMGDTVNLGSRLEGLTKVYGVDILISQQTYDAVKAHFACRKIDRVRVKGKKVPVTVYELLDAKDAAFVQVFEKALELYFAGTFTEAGNAFARALELRPHDDVSLLFVERCAAYAKHPPGKDWDGVFVMETK